MNGWLVVLQWATAMVLGGVLSQMGYRQGRRHERESQERKQKWAEVDKAIAEGRWADAHRLISE